MSLVRFGVRKPVPINLLTVGIIIAGIASGLTLRREFFPSADPDMATVTLPYPGATPEEIEETLAIKVEDKLAELDEIDDINTIVSEGGGGITLEFYEGVNPDKALDEIERAVDSLLDLPEDSETIQVQLLEPRLPVIRAVVFGDLDEPVLKEAIRSVKEDLRTLPGMGEVLVEGVRDYEIRVDVRQEALLKLGLSLPDVARTIQAWMREVPGGTVKSDTGNVRVRTMGVAERADAIRQIVVKAEEQGGLVRVGDIAEVSDSFVDEQVLNRYNGKPAAGLVVFSVGDQDIVKIAEMVRAYVQGRRGEAFDPRGFDRVVALMPEDQRSAMMSDRMRAWDLGVNAPHALPVGASIATDSDLARFVEGRLELLTRNALYGACLVFLTLLVFLNWRVALWVGVGLVIALMGTIVLMAAVDITLNLLTMFGLIVVLGLLVDDAIVVAENIQARHDRGEPALAAAVDGAHEVLWPVVATVMTSIVAFLPLTFIRGRIGDLLGALPMVVACALLMSLFESLLILPSHMGHTLAKRDRSKPGRFVNWVRRGEKWRDHIVHDRLVPGYGWLLTRLLKTRYLTVAVALAVLIASLGVVAGGRLQFTFLPSNDAETIVVNVRLPIGSPIERTNEAVATIERAAEDQPEVRSIAAIVGQVSNLDTGQVESFSPHIAQMFIELVFVEQRDRQSSEVIDSIRNALRGKIDQVERISYTEISGGPGGSDITIKIAGNDSDLIERAANDIKRCLAQFDGVNDIADNSDLGQLELRLLLKPGAAALGFTVADVAEQVRGFLFGIDAHVFAANEEDIDVRVRLDEATRRSLYAVQNAWVVNPMGEAIPLVEIADIEESETYATIRRIDRQRAVTVTADVSPGISPESITAKLQQTGAGGEPSIIDAVRADYPGLDIWFSGRQEQMGDAFGSLPYGFAAAVVMIYVILAWLFSSYFQPIVVLLAVPFSLVGVIWGHIGFGYDLTFLSLIGFVALSGIVVNDSLILVEFFNARIREGEPVAAALVAAGRARLRAILLTTITTVLGLMPLILEQSFQAQFLIPMAIAIAMGLLSATVLILIVLPCLILVLDDLKRLFRFLWFGHADRPAPADQPA